MLSALGPDSETPPGHWNVLLNYVAEHPATKKLWEGKGEPLDDLEWYFYSETGDITYFACTKSYCGHSHRNL